MTLLMENATVTAVGSPVERDDFDAPDSVPASKWSGSERAYLVDAVEQGEDGAGPAVVHRRSLVVTSSWARTVGVDTDDLLTIDPDDGAPFTARADIVAVSTAPAGIAIPAAIETARIELQDA